MKSREAKFVEVNSITLKEKLIALLDSSDSFIKECANYKLQELDQCIYSLEDC